MGANWKSKHRNRLCTPEAAIARIRPGERIFVGSGSAVPLGLFPYLTAPRVELSGNEILHLLTLGDAPYVDPRFNCVFRHNALFIGPNVREAVTEGRADYTPVFLSEIPGLIRRQLIPIDVALISVTPPDDDGACCLGTHVDIAPAAIEAARLVIAEVNPRMPRTHGQTHVRVDRIDCLVEIDHPLPELVQPPADDETEQIAANVARLVMDGSTLQIGIGALPDAILRALAGHNDLGIHTEMFSDGVVELAERGVITGAKKTLHAGKLVASILMGTQRLYDFVHDNPDVELYPVDYTNDPAVIARHDYMAAVNTALEIDLTGQVCADSLGARFYSGIGGQVDFIRGAARSNGGKPIIAMLSTACNGEVSRIVPQLSDGAGVVTTRGDVHFVVTEYGIAYLHGKNVRRRAMELIQIAHPKFRPWLLGQAKQRRFVYRDQPEPKVAAAVYPAAFEADVTMKDGAPYRIRPIKPTDEPMLHETFHRFTRAMNYQRHFTGLKRFEQEDLRKFCTIDYDRDMTLVATERQDVITRVVGVALYMRTGDGEHGEAAFLVADTHRDRGVGGELIRRLTRIARDRGLRGLSLDVFEHVPAVVHVLRALGLDPSCEPRGDVVTIRVAFSDKSAVDPDRAQPAR